MQEYEKMHTLKREYSKWYCRTCLKYLASKTYSSDSSINNDEDTMHEAMIVSITNNKHLQCMLEKYIDSKATNCIEGYPQNLCKHCFKKFQDFDTFCKQAQENAKKLQQLLKKDKLEAASPYKTEHAIQEEQSSLSNSCSNDKEFQLLETEAILLDNCSITSMELEIDPFANETVENNCANDVQLAVETDKSIKINKSKRLKKIVKKHNESKKNKFKCNNCNKCFARKITLDAHVRKVHEGSRRPFKCDRCDKAYIFIGGLDTHIKEVHEAQERSYRCTETDCERVYTSFIGLQKHKRLKHSEVTKNRKYVCEQCGITFNQSGNLKSHRRYKHPTEADLAARERDKTTFECPLCNKLFQSRYTLKYHTLQQHNKDKQYECHICGQRRAKKFMLVQHMLVHSTEKIPCEHCGQQFIRKFQLEQHIRAVHMKLKPFKCQYCSDMFASRKTLRHHEYIHTGEKPYVCDICGKAYRQQTCLKNHKKIHEKLKIPPALLSVAADRASPSITVLNVNAINNKITSK